MLREEDLKEMTPEDLKKVYLKALAKASSTCKNDFTYFTLSDLYRQITQEEKPYSDYWKKIKRGLDNAHRKALEELVDEGKARKAKIDNIVAYRAAESP